MSMTKAATNANEIIVFFDIDGVLGDFDSHARAQGKMKPDGKVDYDALDQGWWKTMPVYDGARALVDGMRKVAQVRFLTGPTASAACYGGKAEWVRHTFQPEKGKFGLMDLLICPAKDKGLLAGSRRILVDDRIENVEAWQAAGGIGVHHTGDFARTAQVLAAHIARLQPRAPQPRPGL